MTKTTIVFCNQCRRQSTGEDDHRYWHRLALARKDADFIPPRVSWDDADLCSSECLREFVDKVTAFAVKGK
jgi:hypothetical protein